MTGTGRVLSMEGLDADGIALEMLNDTAALGFAELCVPLEGEPAKASLRQLLAALARSGVVLIEKL